MRRRYRPADRPHPQDAPEARGRLAPLSADGRAYYRCSTERRPHALEAGDTVVEALALLVAEEIETHDGRDTLRNLADGLACPGFPALSNLWVYASLQLGREEEGRPIELGLDLVDPGGRAHRVFTATAPGPRRPHPDMPSTWGVKFHVSVRITAPGVHAIRLLCDGAALSTRPLLVSEETLGSGA